MWKEYSTTMDDQNILLSPSSAKSKCDHSFLLWFISGMLFLATLLITASIVLVTLVSHFTNRPLVFYLSYFCFQYLVDIYTNQNEIIKNQEYWKERILEFLRQITNKETTRVETSTVSYWNWKFSTKRFLFSQIKKIYFVMIFLWHWNLNNKEINKIFVTKIIFSSIER